MAQNSPAIPRASQSAQSGSPPVPAPTSAFGKSFGSLQPEWTCRTRDFSECDESVIAMTRLGEGAYMGAGPKHGRRIRKAQFRTAYQGRTP